MQLRYGNYAIGDTGASHIAVSIKPEYSDSGVLVVQRHTVSVTCTLVATDTSSVQNAQTSMKSQINALKTALSYPNRNLVLYMDNGVASSVYLTAAGSISGVQLTGWTEPTTEGNELAGHRTIQLEFSASYGVSGISDGFVVAFQETLSFSGGCPEYLIPPSKNGRLQRQLNYPLVPWVCSQSGSITGFRAWPLPPTPKFPQALKRGMQITRQSPRSDGLGFRDYTLTYSAEYESVTPLDGFPAIIRSNT